MHISEYLDQTLSIMEIVSDLSKKADSESDKNKFVEVINLVGGLYLELKEDLCQTDKSKQ